MDENIKVELLKKLVKEFVQCGWYIEFDNPCVMLVDKENNVMNWVKLDNDEQVTEMKEWMEKDE